MNDLGSPDRLGFDLSVLRERLRDDVLQVSDLRAVAARRHEIDLLLADFDHQLGRVQRAAVITLVGATGAGKSTLLNALAGEKIAKEGIDRPTTRRPVIYAPPDADLTQLLTAEVERPGGRESEGAPQVARYKSTPGPWTNQILIDAPDLNSIDEQHRAVVAALAERSDVLVVVLHHQSVVEAASASFIDAFAGRRRLVFVLNRSDELTPAARDELLEQIRRLAATRWNAPEAPVFALSARDAQSKPNAEGWAEFCRALHALVRESAIGSVRRLNALGTAARLALVFAEVRRQTEADFLALPAEVAAGIAELERRCASEIAERLHLRRADLTNLLIGEAAKRWDGPGGWALGAGGLGMLGLGAGALLLRRSPLVAAAAATGTLAAGGVQRALRDRRVGDATVLAPSEAEVASWHAEALSPARVRAARLTGDPQKLALPGPESIHAALSGTVEEAWSRLVDRDLPAAAEGSWLRFFRLPIDLPVYAFVAWIVARVAVGFYEARYVGVDFLVNALLLLAAYLLPIRLVVRRALSARARRLLADASARAVSLLGAEAGTAGDAVGRVVAEHTLALERLANLDDAWRRKVDER